MRTKLSAAALALLVVLAGCAGSVPGGPASGQDGASSAETARMDFYVSDEQNAIDQFEHLNVTVTAVGFAKADADGDDAENETAMTGVRAEVADKRASAAWVVRNVENRTVDLTELRGENATKLADFAVPAGRYETAFVYVSDVNGTLKTGERVDVKLPSRKLHVNTPFAVSANQSVDFVFDITVTRAGTSGTYVLRPVVTESGTDVEFTEVGERDEDSDRDESGLTASFVGNVSAGENATVRVVDANGTAVAGASVTVNDEFAGRTNADGTVTFRVPADAEELEVEVETTAAGEAELETALGAVGEHAERDDAEQERDERANENETETETPSVDLAAAFTTSATAGGNATVVVTDGSGTPVEDAVVTVNGEVVGETNADGTVTFRVPADAEELEVVVTKGDAEVTLEHGVVAAAGT